MFRELLEPGVHVTLMIYNFNAYFKEDTNAKVRENHADQILSFLLPRILVLPGLS